MPGPSTLDLTALRARFPLLATCAYLDTANFGPVSRDAADAARSYYEAAMTEPGEQASQRWYETADLTRARVAAMLGADAQQIGFVPNTSTAMVCASLLFEGAGSVLLGAGEHPAVVVPWHARGYPVTVARPDPDGRLTTDSYARALRPDTAVLAVSHVRYDDGRVADLEALGQLCQDRGVHLVVDAVQSFPILKVDVGCGIDVLGMGGFKWLNAGNGAGVLYIRDGLMQRYGLPVAGRRSRTTTALVEITGLDPLLRPRAFELGGFCTPSIHALDGALALVERAGHDTVRARVAALVGELRDGLARLGLATALDGEAAAAGIVSVDIADAPGAERALGERGVYVAERRGRLRISPSWYNDSGDIARCLEALGGTAG